MSAGVRDMESLGATPLVGARCQFLLWAPRAERVEVHFVDPVERYEPLVRGERGYHRGIVEGVGPGARYLYRLDGNLERPDPASALQPLGVHGPSEVVALDPSELAPGYVGCDLADYVIYELHVGTFTGEGTFAALHDHLPALRELGITAIELMPVAQFPGERNWGYDGVYPYAVQSSYGGPRALKALVRACHDAGLAVILDVVYNHLGPEGNYLADFAPYFQDTYRTPWGLAINFDGPGSDEVRRYFIANAVRWVRDFHIDALRLDAVHAIFDQAPVPFLEELAEEVHAAARSQGRRAYLIAESVWNNPRTVWPAAQGGLGLDGLWCDDFHHALHALLTAERDGYYADYGTVDHLARAWRRGFIYAGEYSSYFGRRHGRVPEGVAPRQLVVFSQNHDQIGNRAQGERLAVLIDRETEILGAAVVCLSPFIPLLFMGQEWGERAPFPYFVSHGDSALIAAVREGRRREFLSFAWQGDIPDPQSEETFAQARVQHPLRAAPGHAELVALHRELLALRFALPIAPRTVWSGEEPPVLCVTSGSGPDQVTVLFHFGDKPGRTELPIPAGSWRIAIDSDTSPWGSGQREMPEAIESSGLVSLTLPRRAFALYRRAM